MKKAHPFDRGALSSLFALLMALLFGSELLSAQNIRLFAVSDLRRIYDDGYNMPPAADTINAYGMRGEIVSCQFVIQAVNGATKVNTAVIAGKTVKGEESFPADAIGLNFVGSVPLTTNSPNQPERVVDRKAPARFPDYLSEEKEISLEKGKYQPVWITIRIPGNMKAGSYNCKISVKSDQGEKSIPLRIVVYPFFLPSERHLKVTEWYTTGDFATYHGIDEPYSEKWFGMLKKYAINMAEHRQNVFYVPVSSIKIQRRNGGDLSFDFSRFDQIAEVFWETGKMDYLETGELMRFKTDWFGPEIVPEDFSIMDESAGKMVTMKGADVLPSFLPAFEDHIRQKGWLSKTLFHVKDEPTLVNAMSWREMSSYINRYAPGLKRIDAVETSYLFGDIEIAIPKLDYYGSHYDTYRKMQNEGNELWFYTVGIYQGQVYPNKTIDMPLIDCRLLHWLNYRYDLKGYLHWGWNQWTGDPLKETGEHLGDGWHVYPGRDGIMNSLRWEEMRNGIQDYEYLWMLENRTRALRDSLGTRFSWIDPTQRGKEIAGKVVRSLDSHTDDPEVLYNARAEIVKELIGFGKSPGLYVQTSPSEGSSVKPNEYLVEIFGWTEPGTKIFVNEKEVGVNRQGMFLQNIALESGQNCVMIRAEGKTGTKVISRVFDVEQ